MYTAKDLKSKATISSLADYMLYGDIPNTEKEKDYDARASRAFSECKKVLLRYDHDEESELVDAVYEILSEYEKIYTELGLHFGLMLKEDLIRFTIKDDRDAAQRDTGMLERASLQSLGAFIRNGDHRKKLDRDSFAKREQKAYDSLERELLKYMNEDELGAVEDRLNHYSAVKEEIQFTLGMRAGAGLILQLINDRKYDC